MPEEQWKGRYFGTASQVGPESLDQTSWTGRLSILPSRMERRSCKMNLGSHGTAGMEGGGQE